MDSVEEKRVNLSKNRLLMGAPNQRIRDKKLFVVIQASENKRRSV